MIHEGYCLLIFLFFCEMKLYYVFNQPEPTVSLPSIAFYTVYSEKKEETKKLAEQVKKACLTTISNIDNPLKLQRQLNHTIFSSSSLHIL